MTFVFVFYSVYFIVAAFIGFVFFVFGRLMFME